MPMINVIPKSGILGRGSGLRLLIWALALGFIVPAASATAQDKPTPKTSASAESTNTDGVETSEVSGLPIPRFVSLRADTVNMRSGPGLRYPVEWVYQRRYLPVEVLAEFETWRRIRDPDGTEGWVHQSMISGRRTGIIRNTPKMLRRNYGDDLATVAMLEAGVIVHVQRCLEGSPMCRVEAGGFQGWLKRNQFWGVYPPEVVE